jgi:hypothetical protein
MSNVFAEEAAEQKGFAGTNPIGWVRMVFLQLLGVDCLLLDKGNIFCRDMKMILMERLVPLILVRSLPYIYAISSSD